MEVEIKDLKMKEESIVEVEEAKDDPEYEKAKEEKERVKT